MIRCTFWCQRGQLSAYRESVAARASSISLDLRAYIGRVVAETKEKKKG